MPTITITSSKGGCGKTTLSVLLATELARFGSVALLDTDPAQRAVKWHAKGDLDNPATTGETDFKAAVKLLRDLSERYDYVIVDTEGVESRLNAAMIRMADLAIIPCRDRQQDAEDTVEVVEEIEAIGLSDNRDIDYRIVMNLNAKSEVGRDKLSIALEKNIRESYPTFQTRLHDRVPFHAVFNKGCGLAHLDTSVFSGVPEGTAEMFDLVTEIADLLASEEEGAAA